MAKKPSGVPDGAYWDEDDSEWVLGNQNSDGEFLGLVHYYRADGSLCCKTTFVEGTPHGPFQRFHENGEVSRSGIYAQGVLHGTNQFYRSTAETTENFPRGLGDEIWCCEMDYAQGNVVEGRLFDRQSRRIMENGEPMPDRPATVPAEAHFRKPADRDDYCWVAGASRVDEDNDVVRLGVWRTWSPEGVLLCEEPYDDDGQRHGLLTEYDPETRQVAHSVTFEHGQQVYQRPQAVPEEAYFDEEEELWVEAPADNGQARAWDEDGRLRRIETYDIGNIRLVRRVQEVLVDNSWGQDSTFILDGVPQRKWFRRNEEEELESFPNVCHEHPSAREVEYLFDPHGMMTGFQITDSNGTVLESETLYRNAANETEQRRFGSLEEASRAWIETGDNYTSSLNGWLAELYETGEPSEEEPCFDDELERCAIEGIEALNLQGQGKRAREMFPRYYDGIGGGFWQKYGLVVDSVLHAGSSVFGRVVPPSGKPYIMGIGDGVITPAPSALAMGCSHDKHYLAWAYDAEIIVVDTTETTRFAYPTSYGHSAADALGTGGLGAGEAMGVREIRVLPGGREIILVSAEGIYLLSQRAPAQRLYPLDQDMDTYVDHFQQGGGVDGEFDLEMNLPNSDVSPNGALITCGGMFRRGNMAGLAIWSLENGKLTLKNTSQADAFFPMQAVFHRELPHVAFAATLYASLSNHGFANTTFRIDLADLEDGEMEGFPGGIAQENGVVNTIASFGAGYLLGYDNGYIRWMGLEENTQLLGYLFVGGAIRHIDVSPDQQGFVVASDSGLVAEYRLAPKASKNLVTTMQVEDKSCAAFFRTFEPMIW